MQKNNFFQYFFTLKVEKLDITLYDRMCVEINDNQ